MANDPLPSSGLMWPTFVSTILRSGTQQTTMILVGHLGSRELGAVALGTLWVSMTGMSLVFGGMSGLDTLASQAFGAKNYELVGLWAQRAVVVLVLVCFPLFFSWFYLTGPMLELVGIEPEIAEMAQHFSKIQCLWMFPVFMNRCIQSFWRAQRIVKPYTNMSYISFLLHIPTCYFFVNRWGFTGAAFSLPVNQWCLMFLLLTYDYRKRFSAQCWRPWDSACLSGHAPLLKLAAGGTLTMMGDAWSWHVLSGMAGLLGECVGHPATSLSLCLCLSLSLDLVCHYETDCSLRRVLFLLCPPLLSAPHHIALQDPAGSSRGLAIFEPALLPLVVRDRNCGNHTRGQPAWSRRRQGSKTGRWHRPDNLGLCAGISIHHRVLATRARCVYLHERGGRGRCGQGCGGSVLPLPVRKRTQPDLPRRAGWLRQAGTQW